MTNTEFVMKSMEIFGDTAASNLANMADFVSSRAGLWKAIAFFLTLTLAPALIVVIQRASNEMKKLRNLDLGDFLGLKGAARERSLKAWDNIQRLLKSDDEEKLKAALVQADKLLGELFLVLGYRAESFDGKLDFFMPDKLSKISDLRNVHKIAENLSKDASAKITKEGAEAAVKIYERAFEELGILDPA